jgi:hypothetical protein
VKDDPVFLIFAAFVTACLAIMVGDLIRLAIAGAAE